MDHLREGPIPVRHTFSIQPCKTYLAKRKAPASKHCVNRLAPSSFLPSQHSALRTSRALKKKGLTPMASSSQHLTDACEYPKRIAEPRNCRRQTNGPACALLKSLVPVLFLALLSTTALGSTRRSFTKIRPTGANLPVTLSLGDFGATADGDTDDGPALQAALEALADAGGGTLFVPDGHYAIRTSVSVDFSGRATAVTIEGTPSSLPPPSPGDFGAGLGLTVEFHIKTGAEHNAITLRNLDSLLVQDLVFIGDPLVNDDAKVILETSGIKDAKLLRCEFYGVASFVPGGAIVFAEGGGLQIADSAFLGCAGNSGFYTSIIQIYNWTGISITGTRFVDYGNRPDFYSKTPYMSPFSWISIGGAAHLTNVSPRRDVVIQNVLLDEGAYNAISVRPDLLAVPDGGAISLLQLSNLYVNVTNLGEVGLRIQNVENVLIEDSHLGWSHNTIGAMHLSFVKNALLNHIECVASANTIIAGATVNELSVINSVYETLDSQAPVTRTITTAQLQDGPAERVKQTYLDILGHLPDKPGYVYWTQKIARCDAQQPCASNDQLLNYLNANPAATFTISGRLLDTEGAPLAAATVSLSGTHAFATLTDADGRYSFSNLATAGEYTVTPSKSFYSFTAGPGGAASQTFITPAGNQNADFTGALAHYSISGRINDSNYNPLSAALVTLSGGPDDFESQTVSTNALGDYSFANLPAGSEYSVTVAKSFYTFAPATQSITLAENVVNLSFVGTAQTHSIMGQVTNGTGPLPGAAVTLSGDAYQYVYSDASGNFRFEGLLAGGNYSITVTHQYYTFTPQTINNLLADWNGSFAGTVLHYTISGYVAVGGNGLGGVSMTLGGDTTETIVTNSGGGYAFTVNAGGKYTLAASKVGYVFAPDKVVYNEIGQNQNAIFTGTVAHYSISGRVNDSNYNPLSAALVTLSGGPGNSAPQTVSTNAQGDYSFANLTGASQYSVTVAKNFYTFAPATQSITLVENVVNLNFVGTAQTHSIMGQVTNGTGPLPGAAVTLSGDAYRYVYSDASGNFRFEGLLAGGNYNITVTHQYYTFTPQTINNLLADWNGSFAGTVIHYTISGYVAVGGNGLGGVSMTLGGDATETIVTKSGGGYAFTVNAGGKYTLAAAKVGYVFAPDKVVYDEIGQNYFQVFEGTVVPILLTSDEAGRAIAFNSITMLTEPFELFTTPLDFGPDRSTRLIVFAMNVPDDLNLLTAQAEDSLGNSYPLTVEFIGTLPNAGGIKQVNLRLDSHLATGSDIKINVKVGAAASNLVLVKIENPGD